MRLDRLLPSLLLVTAAAAAHAQLTDVDPDWREADAPAPPAVRTTGLIPVEVARSSLRYGVDPASVSVGTDGIVRYVVVATSPTGVVNALYEAINCNTGEFKVYARYNADRGWTPSQQLQWVPLQAQQHSSHSLVIARTGACLGRAANRNAAQVVRDLRAPVDTRFNIN